MAKMKLKTKGIIKKIALALAGVAALTAVGFGVKAIVDYTKNDLKTISPSFEVGNLGADGKFVDDKSTLYTEESFQCDGLQIKPDFDSTVNYQIFYYDQLDNFIGFTDVLNASYDGNIMGTYARLVVLPENDEDGKISLVERVKYPSQLTVKVKKNKTYVDMIRYNGKSFFVENNVSNLVYSRGGIMLSQDKGDVLEFIGNDEHVVTATQFLSVKKGQVLKSVDNVKGYVTVVNIFMLRKSSTGFMFVGSSDIFAGSYTIPADVDYVFVEMSFRQGDINGELKEITDAEIKFAPSCVV